MSDIHERIDELLDKELLDILENGVQEFSGQVDPSGNPIMIRKRPSATMIGKIIDRLKMLKLSKVPVPGTAGHNLLKAAEARGFSVDAPLKFGGKPVQMPAPPPLDEETDDAATA